MAWAAFCKHGKSDLVILKGTQRSENYKETLNNNFLTFASRFSKE